MTIPRLREVDARGGALALLLSVLWGANPVAIKIGLADAPPLRLAWMRFVVGGAVILAWAGLTGRLRGLRVERHEWRPLAVVGLLFTAQIATMNIGTALTTAAHSSVLLNLYAVHTVVLAHFLIPGDRLTVGRVAGVLVAYAGIVALFRSEVGTGAPTLLGDVLMFVSGLILGERTVYLAGAVHRLDAVKLLLTQAVIGIAVFLAGSALFEARPTQWTASLAASIVFQGAVIAGFNFVANLWLLERYRPSALATIFLTQPIFGVVAAAIFAGDRITADLVVASVAVAVGIGLTNRR